MVKLNLNNDVSNQVEHELILNRSVFSEMLTGLGLFQLISILDKNAKISWGKTMKIRCDSEISLREIANLAAERLVLSPWNSSFQSKDADLEWERGYRKFVVAFAWKEILNNDDIREKVLKSHNLEYSKWDSPAMKNSLIELFDNGGYKTIFKEIKATKCAGLVKSVTAKEIDEALAEFKSFVNSQLPSLMQLDEKGKPVLQRLYGGGTAPGKIDFATRMVKEFNPSDYHDLEIEDLTNLPYKAKTNFGSWVPDLKDNPTMSRMQSNPILTMMQLEASSRFFALRATEDELGKVNLKTTSVMGNSLTVPFTESFLTANQLENFLVSYDVKAEDILKIYSQRLNSKFEVENLYCISIYNFVEIDSQNKFWVHHSNEIVPDLEIPEYAISAHFKKLDSSILDKKLEFHSNEEKVIKVAKTINEVKIDSQQITPWRIYNKLPLECVLETLKSELNWGFALGFRVAQFSSKGIPPENWRSLGISPNHFEKWIELNAKKVVSTQHIKLERRFKKAYLSVMSLNDVERGFWWGIATQPFTELNGEQIPTHKALANHLESQDLLYRINPNANEFWDFLEEGSSKTRYDRFLKKITPLPKWHIDLITILAGK